MTLRYLEVFLELARTPNMRDVAARLFISQAAVSSALRDFEAELGVTLFDRLGRGIRLNERGRLLEGRLAPLYTQLRNSLALVSSKVPAGRIRVGASATLSESVLPQILYEVEIDCQSGNTTRIVRAVELGRLDLGFVEGDVQSLHVRTAPLAREELVVVSTDRELAATPRELASLMGAFWLLREQGSGTRECLMRQLAARGLRPGRFMEFERTDSIRQLLHNPGTLACLSPRVVEHELRSNIFVVVPVQDAVFERLFSRVEHKDSPPSPLRDALAGQLTARLTAPFCSL